MPAKGCGMSRPAYIGRSREAIDRAMTEDELLEAITQAATYLGWRWTHSRRSDLALQMGHSGFPDLVLARDGHVLFLELKTEAGIVSPDQRAWIDALAPEDYPGGLGSQRVDVYVARPRDLDRILRLLGARGL